MRVIIAAAGLLFLTSQAGAQAIRGTVLVEGEDRRVAQAQVSVLAAGRERVLASALSSDGTFHFDLREAGRYRLRVQALGYASMTTQPIEVGQGVLLTVELRLRPDAIALEPLRVLTQRNEPLFMRDVRERQKMGFGTLVTREQLDERAGFRLEDVIRGAGMSIEYVPFGPVQVPLVIGRLATNRVLTGAPCYSALYRNGQRWFPRTSAPYGAGGGRVADPRGGSRPQLDAAALERVFDLFQYRPEDVEAIEIYRSRSQTPAEWADPMSECGVVAVWLRGGYGVGGEASPWMGGGPSVALSVGATGYRLHGTLAPPGATGLEAAAFWRIRGPFSAGLRVSRSSHALSAETTADLLRGGSHPYDREPGARALRLLVASVEPRAVLPTGTPVSPAAALRLQLAHRSFTVDDAALLNRSYRLGSAGLGIGAAAGVEISVTRRIGITGYLAHDRFRFGSYPYLDTSTKDTSADWRGTSWRVGVTHRL